MMKTIFVRLAPGIVLSIILYWVWYSVAANYDYGALAGTYVFHGNGETCTLYLRPDRTFVQELSRFGEIQKSQGHWDRYGQAHVSFSNEFLKLSGEEMNADGQAHGQFDKTLGMFPTLILAPLPNGPQFHKTQGNEDGNHEDICHEMRFAKLSDLLELRELCPAPRSGALASSCPLFSDEEFYSAV